MPAHLTSALAHRLTRALGLSTLALPALALAPAACGAHVVVDGTGGGSSTSSTSSTGGTGGGAPLPTCLVAPNCSPIGSGAGPQQPSCFAPPSDQPCPDAADALPFFTTGCTEVTAVQAACSGGPAGQCCYNVTAACVCVGRPFLIDGRPQTARALPAPDRAWSSPAPLDLHDLGDLPPATRAALAAAYTQDALGEHASIASFARFALELMAVGAPSDLVTAAHHAALDEIRHAQIAFSLATSLGGSSVGPGPFPSASAAPLRTDLTSLARAVAIEGCVHETVAALVAAARAEAATNPRIASLLTSIAEDEARHAELAWKTIAWMLTTGDADLAETIFTALADATRDALAASPPPPSSTDLRAFGVLDAAATGTLLAAGITGVVEPCARSLRQTVETAKRAPTAIPAVSLEA